MRGTARRRCSRSKRSLGARQVVDYTQEDFTQGEERYDLVFSEERWNTPVAQTLVRVVRSARFKEAIGALGGYDTAETGQEMWTS